jgi:hypothetical protein
VETRRGRAIRPRTGVALATKEVNTIKNALLIVSLLALGAVAGAPSLAAPKGGKGPDDASATSRPALTDDSGTRILDTSPQIIQPQWTKDKAPPVVRQPEGELVDIRARISRGSQDWYVVRYVAGPTPASAPARSTGLLGRTSSRPAKAAPPRPVGLPGPQYLLPCGLLERVEPLAAGTTSPLIKVSGETTQYHQNSYLFLREVITDSEEAPASPTSRPAQASPAPAGTGESSKPLTDLAAAPPPDANKSSGAPLAQRPGAETASHPASSPAGPRVPPGPAAADILQMLSHERPGKNLAVGVATSSPAAVAPSVAPLPAQSTFAATAGPMIVDRVVQIYPAGKKGWLAIHFVGDNTLREPPMFLLPCALLETAEEQIAGSAEHLKFRVSGETTDYHGRKYLLLRKLLVEKDLGQL